VAVWDEGGGSVPAICFCLKAISSSSISPAGFFLGFLLWMGLVPAVLQICQHEERLVVGGAGGVSYAPPCPEGILDMWWWGGFSVRFVEFSSVRDYFVRAWMRLVAGWERGSRKDGSSEAGLMERT
jgi:hypothetical protein